MSTLLSRANRPQNVSKSSEQLFNDRVNELLASVDQDVRNDLKELFLLLGNTDDTREIEEIVATIGEILFPESLVVELQEEFDLSYEDRAVRDRLTGYRKSIGNVIKQKREEKEWNQEKLAKIAGISQSHVCRLETGVHVPTSKTIEAIAKALDTTPDQLDPGYEN